MLSVSPHLWFDHNAAEAVALYLSVFPDSRMLLGHQQEEAADMPVIDFQIGDLVLSAFNGGPHHKFNDSISLAVTCETQAEVDTVWNRLAADGGQELMCGWVRDRYGVSWQIIPKGLTDLLGDPDLERAKRAVGAMMGMNRIVLADIELAMSQAYGLA